MNRTETLITASLHFAKTRVADATPKLVSTYSSNDQALLLAKLRHNRLIDVFTGVACHSLQRHIQTNVPGVGQVETDEIYIGVDQDGTRYVFPIQANRESGTLTTAQIERCFAACANRFPSFICRPIGAEFMGGNDMIALFYFERSGDRVAVWMEKQYHLVPPDEVTASDLATYRTGPFG